MKTIGDLERWLKGAGKGYTLRVAMERDKFNVHYALPNADGCYYIAPKSATLEGAFDNLLEELRRKDNGAESMRTEKKDAAFQSILSSAWTGPVSSPAMRGIQNTGGSIGPASSPTIGNAQVITCPKCFDYPAGFDFNNIKWVCSCTEQWQGAISVGTVYWLKDYATAVPKKWRCDALSPTGWVRIP